MSPRLVSGVHDFMSVDINLDHLAEIGSPLILKLCFCAQLPDLFCNLDFLALRIYASNYRF